MPRLEDPDEILAEAVRTTAELQYVHARVDVEARSTDLNPGGADMTVTYGVDLDIDLVKREFHALVEADQGFAGTMRAELLVVGSDAFIRTEAGPGATQPSRWQRSPIAPGSDPRDDVPANDAIATLVEGLLGDPAIEARLVGMEDCAAGTCYHVTTTVAPELTWRIVSGNFLAPPGAVERPPDAGIPELTIDVLIDERTRRLQSLSTSVAAMGAAADIRVVFTDHDREVHFLPPPPDQVDDLNLFGPGAGFGEEQILEDVGSEVTEGP